MFLCHWQDNVWADGTWSADVWACVEAPPVVAGTGPRTGDERLAVLASFERGEIEAVAIALQKQRDKDVHTALDNVDADDSETALILYWIAGGF